MTVKEIIQAIKEGKEIEVPWDTVIAFINAGLITDDTDLRCLYGKFQQECYETEKKREEAHRAWIELEGLERGLKNRRGKLRRVSFPEIEFECKECGCKYKGKELNTKEFVHQDHGPCANDICPKGHTILTFLQY